MFCIVYTEEKHTEKQTNDHTETTSGATSLALEAQRLLQSHADTIELFHISKDCKIESEMKYKEKHYHIQNKEDVPHVNIKISRKENIPQQ